MKWNVIGVFTVLCVAVIIQLANSSAVVNYQTFISEKNKCEADKYFDPKLKQCRQFYGGGKAIFVDHTSTCANGFIGVRRHPENDKFYYVCNDDSVVIGECADTMRFNEKTLSCEYSTDQMPKNPCNLSREPECQRPGRYPIEENCSCFYICDKTGRQMNAKVFKCPGTSVYSPVNKKCCYSPRIAPTQVLPSNVSDVNAFPPCAKPGRFRTPTDCSKYYICSAKTNGKFYQTRHRCPDGFMFDVKQGECLPADNVECTMMTAAAILNLYDYYQQQKQTTCNTQKSCDSIAPVLPSKQPPSGPCDVESEPVSSSLTESEEDTTLAITVEVTESIVHNNHGERSDEEEPELGSIQTLPPNIPEEVAEPDSDSSQTNTDEDDEPVLGSTLTTTLPIETEAEDEPVLGSTHIPEEVAEPDSDPSQTLPTTNTDEDDEPVLGSTLTTTLPIEAEDEDEPVLGSTHIPTAENSEDETTAQDVEEPTTICSEKENSSDEDSTETDEHPRNHHGSKKNKHRQRVRPVEKDDDNENATATINYEKLSSSSEITSAPPPEEENVPEVDSTTQTLSYNVEEINSNENEEENEQTHSKNHQKHKHRVRPNNTDDGNVDETAMNAGVTTTISPEVSTASSLNDESKPEGDSTTHTSSENVEETYSGESEEENESQTDKHSKKGRKHKHRVRPDDVGDETATIDGDSVTTSPEVTTATPPEVESKPEGDSTTETSSDNVEETYSSESEEVNESQTNEHSMKRRKHKQRARPGNTDDDSGKETGAIDGDSTTSSPEISTASLPEEKSIPEENSTAEILSDNVEAKSRMNESEEENEAQRDEHSKSRRKHTHRDRPDTTSEDNGDDTAAIDADETTSSPRVTTTPSPKDDSNPDVDSTNQPSSDNVEETNSNESEEENESEIVKHSKNRHKHTHHDKSGKKSDDDEVKTATIGGDSTTSSPEVTNATPSEEENVPIVDSVTVTESLMEEAEEETITIDSEEETGPDVGSSQTALIDDEGTTSSSEVTTVSVPKVESIPHVDSTTQTSSENVEETNTNRSEEESTPGNTDDDSVDETEIIDDDSTISSHKVTTAIPPEEESKPEEDSVTESLMEEAEEETTTIDSEDETDPDVGSSQTALIDDEETTSSTEITTALPVEAAGNHEVISTTEKPAEDEEEITTIESEAEHSPEVKFRPYNRHGKKKVDNDDSEEDEPVVGSPQTQPTVISEKEATEVNGDEISSIEEIPEEKPPQPSSTPLPAPEVKFRPYNRHGKKKVDNDDNEEVKSDDIEEIPDKIPEEIQSQPSAPPAEEDDPEVGSTQIPTPSDSPYEISSADQVTPGCSPVEMQTNPNCTSTEPKTVYLKIKQPCKLIIDVLDAPKVVPINSQENTGLTRAKRYSPFWRHLIP